MLRNRIRSNSGATILLALLFFLLCALAGSIILSAGSAAAGRISGLKETEQSFYSVTSAAQIMREKGSGAIINISSASWLGNIGQANYAASKAGVVGLTKTACRELARKGVTCNAICPGFIDTNMTRGVPEKVWDTMISKIPMGRAGSPADVANMVAFLASDEANYITGEVINVGGGMIL